MSTAARRKPVTYDDLLAVPEDLIAEILDGELFTSPRPGMPHARVSSGVGGLLFERFDRQGGGGDAPGGWWIVFEPELHLQEDVVVPDVAGWRRERLPNYPSTPWLDVPPDWVCEVISRSTEAIDRGHKLRTYARHKVGHLWILNPEAKTLEVYRLAEPNWVLVSTFVGDETIRAEPFDAVPLDMARWWPPEPISSP